MTDGADVVEVVVVGGCASGVLGAFDPQATARRVRMVSVRNMLGKVPALLGYLGNGCETTEKLACDLRRRTGRGSSVSQNWEGLFTA